jgi:2-dehydropantoate 2-reductase
MRIIVYGSGAVGGYFGGRLAQAGEDVWFIARGEHLHALETNGLAVESPKGDFHLERVRATDQVAQIEPADVILVCVKAWQVPDVAQAIAPVIGPRTTVVPLQNGVEAVDQLASVLGREHVLGGLCRIASQIVAPGHIRHLGIEPYIAFAELDGKPSPRCEQLRDAFQHAGVLAEIPADITAAIWSKFLFIAAVSGVGAVARAPIGVIRSLPGTRQMLQGVMEEVQSVGQAHGVSLPPGSVEKTLAFIDSLPEATTASMQRDIASGRPSELGAQNGAVVRLGERYGIATPVNSFVYASLLPQELQARALV